MYLEKNKNPKNKSALNVPRERVDIKYIQFSYVSHVPWSVLTP